MITYLLFRYEREIVLEVTKKFNKMPYYQRGKCPAIPISKKLFIILVGEEIHKAAISELSDKTIGGVGVWKYGVVAFDNAGRFSYRISVAPNQYKELVWK